MYTEQEREQEAAAMAAHYKISARRENETPSEFVQRAAGALRALGHLIEAHELSSGGRYDDPENNTCRLGLLGAAALGMEPAAAAPRRVGSTLIGDEIAAGAIKKYGEEPILSEQHAYAMLMIAEAMRR